MYCNVDCKLSKHSINVNYPYYHLQICHHIFISDFEGDYNSILSYFMF